VDIAAPGVCILSTYPLEQGEYGTISGTSMASPHVASVAALMLQKNPTLTQAQVEGFLKASALSIPPSGTRSVFDISATVSISWDTDCDGTTCDAVGAGLIQADAAIGVTPTPP